MAAPVYLANLAFDPLWHVGGNRVTGVNYAFDERTTKLNRLRHEDLSRYDCVVFGSSRATLLDVADLEDHRCLNLAVSRGLVVEFVALARWLRDHGLDPARVIVGVDDFNWLARQRVDSLPEAVRKGGFPPAWPLVYGSGSATRFTWRMIRQDHPVGRVYDADFVCRPRSRRRYRLRDCAPVPNWYVADGWPDGAAREAVSQQYAELRAVFPDAEAIGYVAPLHPDWTAPLVLGGSAEGYLDTMYAVAQGFDRFVDFSAPHERTQNRAATYDGQHFDEATNALVAAILEGRSAEAWGLDLKRLDRGSYGAGWLPGVEAWVERRGLERCR